MLEFRYLVTKVDPDHPVQKTKLQWRDVFSLTGDTWQEIPVVYENEKILSKGVPVVSYVSNFIKSVMNWDEKK